MILPGACNPGTLASSQHSSSGPGRVSAPYSRARGQLRQVCSVPGEQTPERCWPGVAAGRSGSEEGREAPRNHILLHFGETTLRDEFSGRKERCVQLSLQGRLQSGEQGDALPPGLAQVPSPASPCRRGSCRKHGRRWAHL